VSNVEVELSEYEVEVAFIDLLRKLDRVERFDIESRMFTNSCPTSSIFIFDHQHTPHEFLKVLTNASAVGKIQRNLHYVFIEILNTGTFPWHLSVQHFVNHHSCRPDITFATELFSVQNLRRHVVRSAHFTKSAHIINVLNHPCKPKIANFEILVMQQYVRWLYVPMNYRHRM